MPQYRWNVSSAKPPINDSRQTFRLCPSWIEALGGVNIVKLLGSFQFDKGGALHDQVR